MRYQGRFMRGKFKARKSNQASAAKLKWAELRKDKESEETSLKPSPYALVDHVYCAAVSPSPEENEIDNAWREGRRIVELGLIAQGLSACNKCTMPLHLIDTINETRHGFASLLHVACKNSECRFVNKIPTGKRHDGKIWDVNTKAAAGILHAGMGHHQLASLMTTLNVPAISKAALKRREREIGPVFEDMAKDCTQEALAEEIAATKISEQAALPAEKEQQTPVGLTVSEDAGWQTRLSGRSFASLSGHATLFGIKTNKVINYATRIKSCKKCDVARRRKKDPAQHSCRKNWNGSSKAMEADMVVSMVKEVDASQTAAQITAVVGDEDTSAIARLRKEVCHDITKLSDSNHIKKTLGNQLYNLKKNHRLSPKTIRYFQKLFNYTCKQNQGSEEGINQGLSALSLHPFGDHTACNSNWCRHLQDPSATYKNLPFGKALQDKSLQNEMKTIFDRYKMHASKLAFLSSTQNNESFNSMVAAKAPKRQYFSSSESLDYRVSAAVLQKNKGHHYVVDANKRVGLSPGKHTKHMAFLEDEQTSKKRQEGASREFKLRRLERKACRMASTATHEVREGDTYASSIGIEKEQHDVEAIPPARLSPCPTPVDVIKYPAFFFDLETTGLARDSHITQLAAVGPSGTFSTFVLPKKEVEKGAERVTGIKRQGNQLYHQGVAVEAVPIKEALDGFLDFLGEEPAVLLGHNIRAFDCQVLAYAASACGKIDRLRQKTAGFVDSLPLFKEGCPGLDSYRQETLYRHFFGEVYAAHDALADAKALQKLVEQVQFEQELLTKHSFNLDFIFELQTFSAAKKNMILSWEPLVSKGALSKSMAQKAAGSGLSVDHLKLAYSRGGVDAVEAVLSEQTPNRKNPRNQTEDCSGEAFNFCCRYESVVLITFFLKFLFRLFSLMNVDVEGNLDVQGLNFPTEALMLC